MSRKSKILMGLGVLLIIILAFTWGTGGATNFDRLVLGSANYGTDPNVTADLTFQNDEYITNSSDGTLDFGAANLTTTGSFSSILNVTMTGDLLGVDSLKARTLYLTEAIGNVTNITMTGDLLGADSVKGRTLYLTEAIGNVTDITMTGALATVTNITMTGDLLTADSIATAKMTVNSNFTVGASVGDTNSFTKLVTNNTEQFLDTVTVAGSVSTSVYIVSINDLTPVAADLLGWSAAVEGKLLVTRADTTTAGLKYSWIKIK